jgi:predicted  nucleic acid-binding Zn-ribbon protein
MPEVVAELLRWLVPAAIVFGSAAVVIAILVWVVRRARLSPRAMASAQAVRDRAGTALVRLDDAVDELDVEVGLSGALYGGDAPGSLRRARLTAQHARDEGFAEFRRISQDDVSPVDVRRGAQRIVSRADAALATIDAARGEHRAWMQANVSAAQQVTAARARLAALRAAMGDPTALVADLTARFAPDEWRTAAEAATLAKTHADAAAAALDRAEARAADPTASALADLADAERSLRAAEADARTLEESHRLITQAAHALPSEFEAARTAVRQAMTTRDQLAATDAERLGAEIRAVANGIDAAEQDAARHPTRAIDTLARLRDRLDLALGDARTAQQRLRGARTALPGALAAARGALARAEASVVHAHAGVDARTRLRAAQDELAAARNADDPVAALDAARRALRHAEDAQALADHDRGGKV